MGVLLTLSGWVLSWVSGAALWATGFDLAAELAPYTDLITALYRFALTLSCFLMGDGVGVVFLEAAVLVPLICLALKCAIWIKGLIWTGGQA